jgi:apolipoprotein N-acyltransferase
MNEGSLLRLIIVNSPQAAHTKNDFQPLSWPVAISLGLVACAGYGIAFATVHVAAAILVALPCLCALGRLRTSRQAFYGGLFTGVAMYGPHLWFFWSIFGFRAPLLWLIAGFPVGVFVLLVHLARRRIGAVWTMALTPVLWTGLEYFRSEVWYLKFAWLLPGQAAAFLPGLRWEWLGVYGLGFMYVLAAAMVVGPSRWFRIAGGAATALLAVIMYYPPLASARSDGPLHVAGVQLEFASPEQVADALDRLALAHPEAQILVLSEYSFLGPVPQNIRDVVRKHGRYLIAGGMARAPGNHFYDTAFVVGPDGHDIFQQGKSLPVQFMDDGLPAPRRRVWDSPWGKIGIGICYDVSYARVMDDFVRQGAQGLILPTMDLVNWGLYERRMLHGRLAPVRSAEYGIPVFGVWSSGESQLVDGDGQVIAAAGYPGQGQSISGAFRLARPGRLPPDRLPAIASTTGLAIVILGLMIDWLYNSRIASRSASEGVGRKATV